MNKYQALYEFYNSFGIPAYEENSVPENPIATNYCIIKTYARIYGIINANVFVCSEKNLCIFTPESG